MALEIYNTLSRSLEPFEPKNPPHVSLYTCGPTVYNFPHIGNYRAYIFGDILKRVLSYNGYVVQHIMNLTDVDDKTIRDSQKVGKPLKEFTEYYTQEFYKDRDALNIIPAEKYTKATDYIPEMVALIEKLLGGGIAYRGEDGSVYFSITKDAEYGKLSHLDLKELTTNAQGRMRLDEYEKDNIQDFALWKAWDETDGDVYWETKLGKGRPGWHIECSAMSMSTLGETIDIHTGGIDNMFPHHENEIAQSECATGKPFVKYWMHNQWLLVDGKKMAKSAGNFYTLRDIEEKGYNPLAYRYLTLMTHYRTPLNFSWEALTAAQTALNRIYENVRSLQTNAVNKNSDISETYKNKFTQYINTDLGIPQALALTHDLLQDPSVNTDTKLQTLIDFDQIFGLGFINLTEEIVPEEIKKLADTREVARQAKDFAKSDELRKEIESLGYTIKDTPNGYEIRKA